MKLANMLFLFTRIVEAAFVAGEDEVTLTPTTSGASGSKTTSFNLNLKSMHEIREENGTARPIQRKLTSQLQVRLNFQIHPRSLWYT